MNYRYSVLMVWAIFGAITVSQAESIMPSESDNFWAFETSDSGIKSTFRCSSGRSPLYKKRDANDYLEMTLVADLDSKWGPETLGIISVRQGETHRKFAAVKLVPRGNSRGVHCEAKPFRMIFLHQKINRLISQKLDERKNSEGEGDQARLVAAYRILMSNKIRILELAQAKENIQAPKGGPFEGLGDDIKVVTHCGKPQGFDLVGGATELAQDVRLLQEYYMYEVLGRSGMMLEKTRLAQIEYLDPLGKRIFVSNPNRIGVLDNKPVRGRPAFFREPPNHMARRCDLVSKLRGITQNERDSLSEFQALFLNFFASNYDYSTNGHNMNILFDRQGRTHISPYDFDLSGPIVDGYSKNPSFNDSPKVLRDWLDNHMSNQEEFDSLRAFLSQKSSMRLILENAYLDEKARARMLKWFDSHIQVVEEVVWRRLQQDDLPVLQGVAHPYVDQFNDVE